MSQMMDLAVHMEDSEGDKAWAYYEKFTVGSSDQQYAITSLGRYHGSAGKYHIDSVVSCFVLT